MAKFQTFSTPSTRVCLVLLAMAAGLPANALTIVPTWDGTINSDPNATAIKASIQTALDRYGATFASSNVVNITFAGMTDGLGQSQTEYTSASYASVLAALTASRTSTDDATSLLHLAAGPNNPVNGDTDLLLTKALARTLGLSGATAMDSTISLNMSYMNITRGGAVDPNKYDLQSVVMHEVDEVLGTSSGLNQTVDYGVTVADLFRYDSTGTGTRSHTLDPNAHAWLSIDGTNNLIEYNQDGFGDFGDFADGGTPHVQNAYGTPGTAPDLDIELHLLDVLGWTLTANSYTDIYTGPAGGTVVVPNTNTANVRILEGGVGTNTLEAATTTIQSLTMSAGITAATLNMGGGTLVIGSSASSGTVGIARAAKGLTIGVTANDGFLTAGSSGAATLNFDNSQASAALTVNSVIKNNAGAGAVSVAVSGVTGAKIIFRGNNTYTGTTTVHSGTLIFDAASSALTGAAVVETPGVLAIGNDSGAMASRLFSFISAANSGTIDIRSDGALSLTSATTLSGTGTLANHGVLGVVGTASTTNRVVANVGSVLLLADGSARLNVGSLAINSGAKIAVASTYGFTLGALNTVVHATGTVAGTFAVDAALSVDPGTGLRWISRTVGQDVLLGLQYHLALPAGLTPQQNATGGGLSDATLTHGDADLEAEYNRMALLSGPALAGALDRLSGHDRAAVDSVAQSHAIARGQNILKFAQMQLVNDETVVSRSTDQAMRATALGDLQSGDIEDAYGLQFFVDVGHVTESRDGQQTGVLAADATGDLFTVGVHNQLTDNFNVGCAFTYDKTKITSGNGLGKADGTTYGVDVYFSNFFEESQHWFISGVAGIGRSNYDNSRSGITPANLTATSSSHGTQFHAAAQLGYRANVWQDALLTPYAGLSMARNTVNAYAESLPGAPGLALSYEAHTAVATEAVLGLNFAQGFRLAGGYRLTPSAGVAWHHQLGNSDNGVVTTHFSGASDTSFNTYLGNLPDDAVEIQGAVSLQIPGGLKVFVDGRHYASAGSSNGASQDRIGAGLRCDF